MITSAPLSQQSPEETNNPGQELADREFNPDHHESQSTAAGNPTDPRGNDTAAGDSSDPRDELRDREVSSSEGSYYYKKTTDKNSGFWRGPGTGQGWRQKRIAVTAAVAAATATVSILIFLSLLPLKILHIVTNLENHFYATSQNALQDETDSLFKQYITQHVLPSYRSCGTTTSRACNVQIVGSNPVSNLYRTWANNRLENKLAENYGIEFQKRADGWYLKSPSSPSGVNIGSEGKKIDSGFQKADLSEMRQAIKNETRWYNVYTRFKVGSLLQEKYGVRRCLFFCSATDPFFNKVADQKLAAKLFLTQRVILPRNQNLGIAIECILTGCAADKAEPTNSATSGDDGALYGAPQSATDEQIRQALTEAASKYELTDISVDELFNTYKDISDKGFQNYLVSEALSPIIGDTASKGIADKIPLIGWVDLTARLVHAGDVAGPNLKKLSYETNASAAVALFAMYRSYADEVKTGHANATEVGSLTESLDPGDSGAATDPEVGGNVGAEATPLYSQLIDGASPTTQTASASSLLSSLFSPSVLAAGTTSAQASKYAYTCNDGKPVPKGQSVCNEEILGIGSHYANLVSGFLDEPGVSVLKDISNLWLGTIGKGFDFVGSIFGKAVQVLNIQCDLPLGSLSPLCQAENAVSKGSKYVLEGLTKWLIPDPFSTNMSGGRTFDMVAAGADVAGNDSAHTTLGGQALTDQQVAVIVNQQQNEDLQEYKNQPLVARLFDKNSEYSPVTKLAMALPMSWSSVGQNIASFFSNPFSKLGSGFSTLFSSPQAMAASSMPDPFGVTQYGYPAGSIPDNPETYWDQNCSDNPAYAYRRDNSWNQAAADSAAADPNQLPRNTGVNPCLLIMAATGSDGGIYDSSLLTADDLSQSSSSSAQSSDNTTTTSVAGASIDMTSLYNDSTSIACAPGTRDLGIQTGYHNSQPIKIRICAIPNLPSTSEESNGGYGITGANGQAIVNSRVSGTVLSMVNAAAADHVTLTASSSFRTMAHQTALYNADPDPTRVAVPGTSNHQMGLAIDFEGLPSTPGPVTGNIFWDWLSSNASKFSYKNYPAEAWHWSPTGD